MLVWNVCGAGNDGFIKHVKNYINLYHADVLIIMETKISSVKAAKCIEKIGRSGVAQVDPISFSTGIWRCGSVQKLILRLFLPLIE